MISGRSVRSLAAPALVVGFALLSGLRFPVKWLMGAPEYVGGGEMSRHERRFRELKDALPSRGVVGYVSGRDSGPHGPGYDHNLTRYVLAPVIVVRSTDRPLVVGNFYGDDARGGLVPEGVVPEGLELVRDFGEGVMLFRRSARASPVARLPGFFVRSGSANLSAVPAQAGGRSADFEAPLSRSVFVRSGSDERRSEPISKSAAAVSAAAACDIL